MLILRLTVTCTFLIALSFLVTTSLAHNNPTVLIDSEVGGALPSRQLCVADNHPAHDSILARACVKKKMKISGIEVDASAYVWASQELTFSDGSVGRPYGHWELYAKVTDGISPNYQDCGYYAGSLSRGARDYPEDDIVGDDLDDASAESYADVYNQISQSATCDL